MKYLFLLLGLILSVQCFSPRKVTVNNEQKSIEIPIDAVINSDSTYFATKQEAVDRNGLPGEFYIISVLTHDTVFNNATNQWYFIQWVNANEILLRKHQGITNHNNNLDLHNNKVPNYVYNLYTKELQTNTNTQQ